MTNLHMAEMGHIPNVPTNVKPLGKGNHEKSKGNLSKLGIELGPKPWKDNTTYHQDQWNNHSGFCPHEKCF